MKLLALIILTSVASFAGEILSWDASPSADATGYKVYYSSTISAPKPWTVLGATSGLSLTNNLSGRWFYYVTATNDCCESEPSEVAWRPLKPGNPKVR